MMRHRHPARGLRALVVALLGFGSASFSSSVAQEVPAQVRRSAQPSLEVEILDSGLPWNAALGLDPARLPVVRKGEQLRALADLAGALKGLAAGDKGSARLRLVCDPTVEWRMVQALMHVATRLPGEDLDAMRRRSPQLARFELALRGTEEAAVPLNLMEAAFGLEESEVLTVRTTLSDYSRQVPADMRQVPVHLDGDAVFEVTGLGWLSPRPADHALQVNPRSGMLILARRAAAARKVQPEASVRLELDPATPFRVAFCLARASHDAGYRSVRLKGLTREEYRDLLPAAQRAATPSHRFAPNAADGPLVLPGPAASTPQAGATPRRTPAEAVESALRWLASTQAEDGHWDADAFPEKQLPEEWRTLSARGARHDVGVTGLALLALMGAGNHDLQGPYHKNVTKGIEWLLSQQDEKGTFGSRAAPTWAYSHAIATLAIAESRALSRRAAAPHREPLRKAVELISLMRNPYRAWRYGIRDGDNDLSVTTWMIMALASARQTGIVPEHGGNLTRDVLDYVDGLTDPKTGRIGYSRRGQVPARSAEMLSAFPPMQSESMTACGLVTRLFCEESGKDNPHLAKSLALLRAKPPVWNAQTGQIDMYYWYFGTLATYQHGGEAWKHWNDHLKQAVLPHQRTDGRHAGSWDPAGPWGPEAGRIYATALMTLSLEVSARYANLHAQKVEGR